MASPTPCLFQGSVLTDQTIYRTFDLFRKEIVRGASPNSVVTLVKCFMLLASVQMRAVIFDAVHGTNTWSTSGMFEQALQDVDNFAAGLVCHDSIPDQVDATTTILLPHMLVATQVFFLGQNMRDPTDIVEWTAQFDEDPITRMNADSAFCRMILFSFLMAFDGDFVTLRAFLDDWGFRAYGKEFFAAAALLGVDIEELFDGE
jgi:hypothetical protein